MLHLIVNHPDFSKFLFEYAGFVFALEIGTAAVLEVVETMFLKCGIFLPTLKKRHAEVGLYKMPCALVESPLGWYVLGPSESAQIYLLSLFVTVEVSAYLLD